MSGRLSIDWEPPGPVAEAFLNSWNDVNLVNGPVGSGKTTTSQVKATVATARQEPSTKAKARNAKGDLVAVRKFKLCVIAATYRSLWRTTMPSWFMRLPKTAGEFTGAENGPCTHRIQFALPDDTIGDLQVDFIAIGENSVEDTMRGYEPTAFYLVELDLLPSDIIMHARMRLGRYPPMDEGGPTWTGIWADCNAPEFESWLHEDVFLKSPAERAAAGVSLFVQPSGLSPRAENLQNLKGGASYYADKLKGQPLWFVKRMVHNRPGFSRAGQPVYEDYEDDRHVAAANLEYIPGLPLIVGMDGGLSPAATFKQRTHLGQWRVLAELVTQHGVGATRFGDLLRQFLRDEFPHAATIIAYADPAAFYGADKDGKEKNWAEIVEAKARIVIRPAPTNDPSTRWDAVKQPLTRSVEGGPAFLLSPRCTTLRIGFNSGYRFRKARVTDTRFAEQADKNKFSHVHDALQYGLSGGGEDHIVRARVANEDRRRRQGAANHQHDWDPFGAGANA